MWIFEELKFVSQAELQSMCFITKHILELAGVCCFAMGKLEVLHETLEAVPLPRGLHTYPPNDQATL